MSSPEWGVAGESEGNGDGSLKNSDDNLREGKDVGRRVGRAVSE